MPEFVYPAPEFEVIETALMLFLKDSLPVLVRICYVRCFLSGHVWEFTTNDPAMLER